MFLVSAVSEIQTSGSRKKLKIRQYAVAVSETLLLRYYVKSFSAYRSRINRQPLPKYLSLYFAIRFSKQTPRNTQTLLRTHTTFRTQTPRSASPWLSCASSRCPQQAPPNTMRSPAKSPVASARGRPYDRHSGTGTRGLPKKKGAGGKGVWGAAMDQEGVACLDKKDPNYDSDQDQDNMPPQLDLTPPNPASTKQPTRSTTSSK